MKTPTRRVRAAGLGVALLAAASTTALAMSTDADKVVRVKDARLKFEVNATDRDAGVQLFVDADEWKELSLLDPTGHVILKTTTAGAIARQGGTELFLESAEPSLAELSLPKLFQRFPAGRYRVRGVGIGGERYVGSAILTHRIPAGPKLVSPLPIHGLQRPDETTVTWKPVPAPNGTAIIGYQVLVVRSDTGIRSMPKVTLDVTMPPSATSMRVPPGFLRPGSLYEWEVLAIERGGNQTLSSSTFRTGAR